jgi:hypothetical protein
MVMGSCPDCVTLQLLLLRFWHPFRLVVALYCTYACPHRITPIVKVIPENTSAASPSDAWHSMLSRTGSTSCNHASYSNSHWQENRDVGTCAHTPSLMVVEWVIRKPHKVVLLRTPPKGITRQYTEQAGSRIARHFILGD